MLANASARFLPLARSIIASQNVRSPDWTSETGEDRTSGGGYDRAAAAIESSGRQVPDFVHVQQVGDGAAAAAAAAAVAVDGKTSR
jgi:hypothetical protein